MLSNRFAPTPGFVMAPVQEGRAGYDAASSADAALANTDGAKAGGAGDATIGAAAGSGLPDTGPTPPQDATAARGRGQGATFRKLGARIWRRATSHS
jgi:hypothetical protein